MERAAIKKRTLVFLLLCLLITGGFLRFWNIGVPSLWVDEANTVFAARSVLETGQDTMPSGMIYGRSRLHTVIVAFFYSILDSNESTTRMPSVIFGMLSILMSYSIAKRIFNDRVGLFTAFLITFSHFEVGWSRTGRMYTLLQFLTLAILYCFIRGFERNGGSAGAMNSKKMRPRLFPGMKDFFARHSLSVPWLFLCLIIVIVSSIYVHLLTGFMLLGLIVYCLFIGVSSFFIAANKNKIGNKYILTSFLAIMVFILSWVFIPALREKIVFFLSYTPPWAMGAASAQNKLYFLEFLISPWRFPLAAFFFIGSVQLFSRNKRLGWIPLWGFSVPFFLLSFIFTHRVPAYLFYVYPLFLMISSFGFINLLEMEGQFLIKAPGYRKRWVRTGFISLFFLIFILSPWLRITLNIPFNPDGVTNMAVTPDEWREACDIVKTRQQPGDLIVTSLPQIATYYKIQSDYGLNWANLEKAIDEDFKNSDDEWIDMYVGIRCIETLTMLETIVRENPRGWIIITKFHLEHDNHTPEKVRNFIISHFNEPAMTNNKTVYVYHWQDSEGEV